MLSKAKLGITCEDQAKAIGLSHGRKGSEVAITYNLRYIISEGNRGAPCCGAQRRTYCFSFRTYLDEFVPTRRNDDRVLGVGAESHTGDPFGVSLVSDGELAVAKGVP